MRLILDQDGASGEVSQFLTNEPDLMPGVLVPRGGFEFDLRCWQRFSAH